MGCCCEKSQEEKEGIAILNALHAPVNRAPQVSAIEELIDHCYYGNVEGAKKVLAANTKATDLDMSHLLAGLEERNNYTVLLACAGADDPAISLELAKLALAHPACTKEAIDTGDSEAGRTALFWAAYKGRVEVVKALINAGADVNKASTKDSMTPFAAATSKGHTEIAELISNAPGFVKTA